MYIYYQQSYEAHEHIEKRSRQARAKRIIQRASRARRQRRRRRAYVAAALQRLSPGGGQCTGVGVESALTESIATRPGTWVPGRVLFRDQMGVAGRPMAYGVKKPVAV